MFDPIQWVDECEAALVDADHLAVWLAQSGSANVAADLESLRIRIAVLRAELQRARVDITTAGRGGDALEWPYANGSLWSERRGSPGS